jgi:murein DD-endopeptidase MepM/ murein hydrolase activator NlpD
VVRSFPGDNRRRTIAAAAACLVAGLGLAAPLASANDDLKDKQRQVEKKIDNADTQFNESSAAMAAAAQKLQAAQAQLETAQAKLAETRAQLTAARIRDQQMQARLDQAIVDLAAARADLAKGKKNVDTQRAEVGSMVAEIYEMGDPQLQSIASLLDAQDPGDMTRSLAATDAVVDEENGELDDLTAAEVLLAVQEQKVEEKKDAVEVRRQEAAENLALMQELESQAEAEADSVRTLVGERSSALAAARKARANDKAVLASLRAEENRIEAALARRAAALAAKARASQQGSQASGGFLNYPVNGYVTSPYGYRVHPIYKYYSLHDGTDFGAGCGAPLYASADGRVMSRYYSTSYGNRLVLDHGLARGVGLASIYNHATHYVVSPGQRVQRGQVIGYVGSTGWSTGCHLHFTVMVNGRTVNPMGWF